MSSTMSSRVSRSASVTAPRIPNLIPHYPHNPPPRHTSLRCSTLPHPSASSSSSTVSSDSNPSSSSCLDPLSFTPEELASQLTLLDIPIFRAIEPEELMSCSWNKKNKLEVAPNVVAFIRKFNHVSFWTVQEVLRSESVKLRAETMSHFIKVAKKLHELNNLHAEFAILSALQTTPLFRLNKTWANLPRKERQTFDKLIDLFSERDNFARLREHMNSVALKHDTCVPYLGLFLTDLVYIDMAHPHSGGMESQQRQFKMNNILRIVSELQQSDYSHLNVIPNCQQYLRSIRYIDELQKFIEDDHYKLSLKLEPPNPPNHSSSNTPSSSSSKESVQSSRDPNVMAELNLSPAKGKGCIRSGSKVSSFVPGHRKSRSDGANIFLSCSGGGSSMYEDHGCSSRTISDAGSEERFRGHHLLDDSLLEDPPFLMPMPPSSTGCSDTRGCNQYDVSEKSLLTAEAKLSPQELNVEPGTKCTFQGCVKRKTLIKDGRRPTMSAWQRYWLQLWGSSLVFFTPKTLTKGLERRDYRSEPNKYQSIVGWLVMVADSSLDNLSFQLTDPVRKNVYRFRAPTPDLAKAWVQCLHHGVRGKNVDVLPTNLISFE